MRGIALLVLLAFGGCSLERGAERTSAQIVVVDEDDAGVEPGCYAVREDDAGTLWIVYLPDLIYPDCVKDAE